MVVSGMKDLSKTFSLESMCYRMSVSALTQLNLFYSKCMGQLLVNTQQHGVLGSCLQGAGVASLPLTFAKVPMRESVNVTVKDLTLKPSQTLLNQVNK